MVYFYILFSPTANKFYIGHTSEPIEERIRKHNSAHKGFTGKYRDWKFSYSETYGSKQNVYAREREVKAWICQSRNYNTNYSNVGIKKDSLIWVGIRNLITRTSPA